MDNGLQRIEDTYLLLDKIDLQPFVEKYWYDVELMMQEIGNSYYNSDFLPEWCNKYIMSYMPLEYFLHYLEGKGYHLNKNVVVTYSIKL